MRKNKVEKTCGIKAGKLQEYLRRKLIHCSIVGAVAGIESILGKLYCRKKQTLWLIEALNEVLKLAEKVRHEMAFHWDELRD